MLRRRPTAFQNVPAVPDQRPSSRSNKQPVFSITNQSLFFTGAEVSPGLVLPPLCQPNHLQLHCPLHPLFSPLSQLESLSRGWSAQSPRDFRWFNCQNGREFQIVNWNQVYPNPDSCHQFYKCANGTLTLETCGNGLLFNEVLILSIPLTTFDL